MRIGIEIRYILLGPTGGVTQLLKGVLQRAFEIDEDNEYFVFCTIFNRDLLTSNNPRVHFLSLSAGSYFADLSEKIKDLKIDVLFRGYPNEGIVDLPMKRQIVQIPDVQHEAHPEFFEEEPLRARRSAFAQALAGAGAIGTISEYSRRVLMERPESRCDDIFLMPPALQMDHLAAGQSHYSAAEFALVPTKRYFLYPANLWPHKNHRRLLEGFKIFLEQSRDSHELILTGHPAGWDTLRAEFAALPVRHLGFVSPSLMRVLMERCEAMAYFSLYEGFGMPILEAFSAGTPVICSNTTSLPEVGGNAVLACDPLDVHAIASLMARIAEDSTLRAELVSRGKARLSEYSWTTSASALISACRRVTSRSLLEAEVDDAVVTPLSSRSWPELPKVSIVVPSFNQGQFLRRTLESVLNQDYPNIELLVMDGGSTDESVKILESYGSRFEWESGKDGGQTAAINKGMRRATGDLLAYLNSDDILMPGAVGDAVAAFLADPDAQLLYGRAHYIDKSDIVTGEYRTEPYSALRLQDECIICQPATFWRRSLLEKIGPFDESLDYVMDYDYWLRAAKSGAKIVYVDRFLASSRLYPETKTMSARRGIYQEIFEVCWRHNRHIGRDYFIGYWHHRIFEQEKGQLRRLRRIPRIHDVLGRIQYRYISVHQRSVRGMVRRASPAAWRQVRGLVARTMPKGIRGAPGLPLPKVSGFHLDNWLEPRVVVRGVSTKPGWVGYVEGTAPIDMSVEVSMNGRVLRPTSIIAGQTVRIEVAQDQFGTCVVELRFSGHVPDPAKRRLAFLVSATNLFSESDLYV